LSQASAADAASEHNAKALSSDVAPFHPSCCSGRRSKSLRWADDDGDNSKDDRPVSYLDAVLRPVRLVAASKPLASGADTMRQGPVCQRGRRSRSRPKLVHGLPARQVEGHIPAHQCLGHRGWVSAPNSDGWLEILQRPVTQLVAVSSMAQRPQARRIPAELVGRCFNCLSYSHRVATCTLPQRCLRCRGFHHIARDCRRPRRPAAASAVVGANSLSPVHAPVDGAAQEAMGGINGIWRRWRRRRQGRLPTEITVIAAANYIIAATATIARCSTESDPLDGVSCEVVRPTNWIDPMLDELATSLVGCRSPCVGCPSTPTAASVVEVAAVVP
jgi:hypothetical protein